MIKLLKNLKRREIIMAVICALLILGQIYFDLTLPDYMTDITKLINSPDGMTMAFLTLSMVEMFHSFNMRSRRQSIFKLPTQNKWLWFAFAGSLVLTFVVIETPLAQAFDFAEINAFEYGIAMLLAAAIIPLVEIYKAIMRAVEKGRN